jgi:hypothetical protein
MWYQINPFTIAIFAYVVCNVLMQYGMLLHWYWLFLDHFVVNKNTYGYLSWFAKPLGYCDLCFCGQLAFWYAAYTFGWSGQLVMYPLYAILIIFIIKKMFQEQ